MKEGTFEIIVLALSLIGMGVATFLCADVCIKNRRLLEKLKKALKDK